MSDGLIDLLSKCTVRLSIPVQAGSGFFIAPGLILTCAHVVEPAHTNLKEITVSWQSSLFPIEELVSYDRVTDVALLRINFLKHPCVLLGDEVEFNDEFYTYGYTSGYIGGESIALKYEGPARPVEQIKWLKFKNGQVKPGISGSPLLNMRTLKVCAIAKRTRNEDFDLGGYGIPMETVNKVNNEIISLNKHFHKSDKTWRNAANNFKPSAETAGQTIASISILEVNEEEKFSRLKYKYSLLEAAEKELTIATESAILSSRIPSAVLEEFFEILVKKATNDQAYPIAYLALKFIDKFNKGYRIIDYVFQSQLLANWAVFSLGSAMCYLTKKEAIIWAHKQLTTRIKDDVVYNTFIQKHFRTIKTPCHDDILSYLLIPDRGPGKYNIDTLVYIIESDKNSEPYIAKWIYWIKEGLFNGSETERDAGSQLLYLKLNDVSEVKYKICLPVIEAAHDYVYYLLKLGGDINKGLYHLIGMLQAKYIYAEKVKQNILERNYCDGYKKEQRLLFFKITEGFNILIKLLEQPEDKSLQNNFSKIIFEIHDMDNLTGFWG